MSVHYLVTAYGNQRHLLRLVRLLSEADPAGIAVQWDESKGSLAPDIAALGVEIIRPSSSITWGDGSYLDAVIESLRTLPPADWIVVLSGQDYPIRPVRDFHQLLDTTAFGGIFHLIQVPRPGRPPWSEDQRRYYFRHRWVSPYVWHFTGGARGIGRVLHAFARLPALRQRVYYRPRPRGLSGGLGLRVRRDPFEGARACRKGADYFALRRELVNELLDSASREPELLEHFRHCAIPTEGWFGTVLGHHEHDLLAETLHFTRFEGRSSPRVLEVADLAAAGHSGKYFARKFSDDSGPVLDVIDQQLLGLCP